jgi:hypothetical protein
MPPIKNVDHRDVYNTLCPQLPVLISSLMNLPHSKIWIHERYIHKAARVPKSQYFGQWHALSSIIKTITNGCGGNKKLGTRVVVDAEYAGCNFSVTSGTNAHSVAFISFGQKESFSAGDSNGDADKTPRWFRFGSSTYCDTATQLSIVSDATGDNSSLDSVVRDRRKRNPLQIRIHHTVISSLHHPTMHCAYLLYAALVQIEFLVDRIPTRSQMLYVLDHLVSCVV